MMRARILLFCAVVLLLAGAAASAATFTVTNLNDSGAGSLRDAIAQANSTAGADTIDFQAGLNGTIPLASTLQITDGLTILGPGADVIAVSGQNNTFVVIDLSPASAAAVTISDLSITDGTRGITSGPNVGLSMDGCVIADNGGPGAEGGGIQNLGTATLTQCEVRDNVITGLFSKGGGISNGGTLTMTGSTLSGNQAAEEGGAINNAGTLDLTDCTFSGNQSHLGGGISNHDTATLARCSFLNNAVQTIGGGVFNGGTLVVTDSTFSGNTTPDKGGAIDSSGSVIVAGCQISGNSALEGGGIMIEAGGSLTLANSTISGNGATTTGGGVVNRGPTVVEACTFLNNTASNDGGGYVEEGTGALTNCTFSGNSADGGGAISIPGGGTLALAHCTLYGNSATTAGGGIASAGTVSLLNTLIASSAGRNVANTGTLTSLGGNFDSDGSAGLTGPDDQSGTDAAPLDPKLAPLRDNGGPTMTFALLPDSPAIDAGLLSTVDTDQRGVPRPQDGDGDGVFLPDVGAYEVVPADLSISMGATPSTVRGRKRLTYTITVTNFGPGTSTNVVVTDLLPAGTGFAGASAKANGVPLPPSVLQTPAFSARGTVVADLGDMALSDTDVVTISVDVFVRKTTISNTATVTSDISDPVPGNNTITVTTVIK